MRPSVSSFLCAGGRLIERLGASCPEVFGEEEGVEGDESGAGEEEEEGFGDEVEVVFVAAVLGGEAVGDVDL